MGALKSVVVPVIKQSVSRTVSVVSVLGIVGAVIWLVWIIYAGAVKPVIKPNPTQTFNANTININNIYPNKKAFSLLSWGTWHFISKDVRETVPIVKENIIKEKEVIVVPKTEKK